MRSAHHRCEPWPTRAARPAARVAPRRRRLGELSRRCARADALSRLPPARTPPLERGHWDVHARCASATAYRATRPLVSLWCHGCFRSKRRSRRQLSELLRQPLVPGCGSERSCRATWEGRSDRDSQAPDAGESPHLVGSHRDPRKGHLEVRLTLSVSRVTSHGPVGRSLRSCLAWLRVRSTLGGREARFRLERIVDHFDLAGGWGVVRVDLRGLAVGASEELPDRSQRLAVRGEAGRERVAQVVKLDRPDASVSAGCLEPLRDLGAIQWMAGLRMGEGESPSPRYSVRRDQRSSSRASRVAIGTDRRVDRSDLPWVECSPRTKVFLTRIRCAAQSTSRQRRPRSSDWRRPVIAAVRVMARMTVPSTSGGGGGAGPGLPRRVGAEVRITVSSGIARRTIEFLDR
jgi:hypothetical protein